MLFKPTRHIPLGDGRYLIEVDGRIKACVACGKGLEHRNGACCHKCDPKWVKHHEAGKKTRGRIYDPQKKPWAGRLADGLEMLASGADGEPVRR